MKKYIELVIKLAKKANKKDEIPVGCIILYNKKIIAKAFNNRQKKKNVLGHAEIIAIKKASKHLKDWRLNECEMIVTLEPCDMCKKVIEESRIKKVYYLENSNYYKNNNIKKDIYNKMENNGEYKEILINYFKKKRNSFR